MAFDERLPNGQSTGSQNYDVADHQDTEVGVAWLGTLCTTTSTFQSGSYVSGTGVSTATRNEWSLVAHEVGHK